MTSRSPDIKTPLCRLAFANLFKARKSEFDGQEKETFDATLLFAKSDDISALKNAAMQAAVDEWGDKAKDFAQKGLIKTPFLDGDGPQAINKKTGERNKGFEGHTFIRCSTKIQPKVFDQKVQPVVSPEEVYSGCYGYAVVHCYTWENQKNGKGISFGINMFQKARDGEKFGGGERNPADFFETVADTGAEASKAADGAAGFFA